MSQDTGKAKREMVKYQYKYSLHFEAIALEALGNLPQNVRRQIGHAIDLLQRDWTGDVKKLEGAKSNYRLRVGKYRVLFELAGKEIRIYSVSDRKDAYGR